MKWRIVNHLSIRVSDNYLLWGFNVMNINSWELNSAGVQYNHLHWVQAIIHCVGSSPVKLTPCQRWTILPSLPTVTRNTRCQNLTSRNHKQTLVVDKPPPIPNMSQPIKTCPETKDLNCNYTTHCSISQKLNVFVVVVTLKLQYQRILLVCLRSWTGELSWKFYIDIT